MRGWLGGNTSRKFSQWKAVVFLEIPKKEISQQRKRAERANGRI